MNEAETEPEREHSKSLYMLINTHNALALINVTTEHGEQRNNYCVAKNVDHRQNHCPKETKANQEPSPNSKKDQ